MQGINLSFQASVFGGLLYVTITRGNTQAAGQLYAAEIWVMLSLCLFAGILTANPEFEPSEPVFSTVIHTASQQTVSVLIFWYTVWFVYTGMDQMAHPPCSRYLFSMAKVDMYHWYRVGWKIVVIPCAIMATIIFVASLRMVLLLLKKPEPKSESEKAMEAQISGVKSYSKYILLALTIFKFFVLGFTVASTELIIRWNHIQNVNSIGGTGQLIPLIVACLAFIRLLYKFFTDFKNRSPSPIVGSQVDPKVDVGVPAKPEDPDKSA
ncbi:hypothetical protein M407DRAFT_28553 [Tulasnella calospora MUT 4182]|nr:hypothetical protein M407DRAFT_28553 [Tulasnella calospora MUT 4182]